MDTPPLIRPAIPEPICFLQAIRKLDLSSGTPLTPVHSVTVSGFVDMAVSPNGRLYVTDGNKIDVYDSSLQHIDSVTLQFPISKLAAGGFGSFYAIRNQPGNPNNENVYLILDAAYKLNLAVPSTVQVG